MDAPLHVRDFSAPLQVQVLSRGEDQLVFQLDGIEAPLANALRRILLAEIPTMAIDTVHLQKNTSIMQDEVLAHRLGLVPLMVDAELFRTLEEDQNEMNEHNTLVFRLKVKCEDGPVQNVVSVHSNVLTWEPCGSQEALLRNNPARPVHDDIVLTKLCAGQEIEAELLAHKGSGQKHAKWSPVASVSYRMTPEVRLHEKVEGDKARKLAEMCPGKVFDVEDLGGHAKVVRGRDCHMCGGCRGVAKTSRVPRSFIFTVETTGAHAPEELVRRAILILQHKVRRQLHAM